MKKSLVQAFIGFIAFFMLLSGCATVQPLGTPTGKPEVTIPNVTKKEVVDALTNQMLSWGYHVKAVTDYNAVYGKRTESMAAAIFLGSRYDAIPEARISYATVETDIGVRVVATLEMITNPGSAFERVTDLSQGKDAHNIQNMLNQLKYGLELSKKGKIGLAIDKNGVVIEVLDNGPASKVGIKAGDRLLKINGKQISTGNLYKIAFEIAGEPGTVVELLLVRGDKQLTFEVERQRLK